MAILMMMTLLMMLMILMMIWWCWFWRWWWPGDGSSGWRWLSPGDGSSGWPVGVLPVHDLWLWTSAPGKGFNTQLSINKVLIKCVIIDYWPHILIHSARVSILALYFSNWTRCDRVRSTTGSWTRPWCTSWATGVVHHNSWTDHYQLWSVITKTVL